jgi:hypothetical protein
MTRLHDLTGLVFGELTVIGATNQYSGKKVLWRCRCSCGNERLISGPYLKARKAPTCGVQSNHLLSGKAKDLTGVVFGELTVTKPIGKNNSKQLIWHCLCSCGNETQVAAGNLGRSIKTCGHTQKTDLTNQRFGRLKVLGPAPRKRKLKTWRCRCNCSAVIDVVQQNLTDGKSRSCGCYKNEAVASRMRTHGMSGTAAYIRLHDAKRRARLNAFDCTDVTDDAMQEKLLAQNYQCHWCDTPFDIHPPHQDHIHPISRGGPHMLNNLVWACRSCNSQKGNLLLHEWFAKPKCRARKFVSATLYPILSRLPPLRSHYFGMLRE